MDIIRKLNREQGVTVIVVTHEADIGAYADRMIVMRDGKIVSDEHQVAPSRRRTAAADVGAAPRRRPARRLRWPTPAFARRSCR